MKLFSLAEIVGDWRKAQSVHFADGGVFDQIVRPLTEPHAKAWRDALPHAANAALQLLGIGETIDRARSRYPRGRRMPYAFDFDSANRILRCRLNGEVNDEVLKDFFQAGSRYAVRTQPAAGVVDLSAVTSFDVSTPAIKALARSAPILRDSDLRRVVIAPSPGIYGLMRMFEMEGESMRPGLQVVRSEREAWAILALRDPRFEPLDT